MRVWERPRPGLKALAKTAGGDFVIDGTTGTWTRWLGNAEKLRAAFMAAFKRRGFKPKTCKVIEVKRESAAPNSESLREQGERGAFYLNIGYLRGLDPDEVWRLLHSMRLNGAGKQVPRFPDNCGARKVLEALARLGQHVERPPALMPAVTASSP